MDMQLFDVALECLRQAGRPTRVLAGKKLFPEKEEDKMHRKITDESGSRRLGIGEIVHRCELVDNWER
jgi:hypothetical protein